VINCSDDQVSEIHLDPPSKLKYFTFVVHLYSRSIPVNAHNTDQASYPVPAIITNPIVQGVCDGVSSGKYMIVETKVR
jgi:hypothetical protein